MNDGDRKQGLWIAVFGAFILLSIFLLIGAQYESQVGRYRMQVITRNNFTDIFVIDTTTGVVKYLGKDEGKPFSEVKGK
jgi:cell division protein FtsX